MQVSNERVYIVINIRPLNAVWFCSFEYGAYLVIYIFACLGQNEGSVREATLPTHQTNKQTKKVSLRMVLTLLFTGVSQLYHM